MDCPRSMKWTHCACDGDLGSMGCPRLTSSSMGCSVEYISGLVLSPQRLTFVEGFLNVNWVSSIGIKASWLGSWRGILNKGYDIVINAISYGTLPWLVRQHNSCGVAHFVLPSHGICHLCHGQWRMGHTIWAILVW